MADDTVRIPQGTATVVPRRHESRFAGPGTDRRGPALVYVLSFVAFFLLAGAWAVAAPWFGNYDEAAHVIRAAGVAGGQVYARPERAIYNGGGYQWIPRSLADVAKNCGTRGVAACPDGTAIDRTRVRVPTTAAGYNPLYYLIVGGPLVAVPNMTGVVLARLVSAALSALFLAAAFTIAWRWRWAALLPSAVLLAATPTAISLAGAVNPNGWEISAAIALWTALLPLALAERLPPARAVRRLLGVAVPAACVLLVARQMGPLLVLITVLGLVVVARPGRVRELARLRALRIGAGTGVVAACLGVAWTVLAGLLRVNAYVPGAPHQPVRRVAALILTDRSGDWVRQLVARFAGGITPPSWALAAWWLLLGALVVPALLLAGRRLVLGVTGLVAATTAVCLILEFRFYDRIGPSQQGRYYLPLLVGVPLIAAATFAVRRAHGARVAGRMLLATAVVTGMVHLFCLMLMMTYWQHGSLVTGLRPFSGPWRPAVGPVAPVVAAMAAAALLVVLALPRLRRTPGAGPRPRPGTGPAIALPPQRA